MINEEQQLLGYTGDPDADLDPYDEEIARQMHCFFPHLISVAVTDTEAACKDINERCNPEYDERCRLRDENLSVTNSDNNVVMPTESELHTVSTSKQSQQKLMGYTGDLDAGDPDPYLIKRDRPDDEEISRQMRCFFPDFSEAVTDTEVASKEINERSNPKYDERCRLRDEKKKARGRKVSKSLSAPGFQKKGQPVLNCVTEVETQKKNRANAVKSRGKKPDAVTIRVKLKQGVDASHSHWFTDFGHHNPSDKVDPEAKVTKKFESTIKELRTLVGSKEWNSIDEVNEIITSFLGVAPTLKNGFFRPEGKRIEIRFMSVSDLNSTGSLGIPYEKVTPDIPHTATSCAVVLQPPAQESKTIDLSLITSNSTPRVRLKQPAKGKKKVGLKASVGSTPSMTSPVDLLDPSISGMMQSSDSYATVPSDSASSLSGKPKRVYKQMNVAVKKCKYGLDSSLLSTFHQALKYDSITASDLNLPDYPSCNSVCDNLNPSPNTKLNVTVNQPPPVKAISTRRNKLQCGNTKLECCYSSNSPGAVDVPTSDTNCPTNKLESGIKYVKMIDQQPEHSGNPFIPPSSAVENPVQSRQLSPVIQKAHVAARSSAIHTSATKKIRKIQSLSIPTHNITPQSLVQIKRETETNFSNSLATPAMMNFEKLSISSQVGIETAVTHIISAQNRSIKTSESNASLQCSVEISNKSNDNLNGTVTVEAQLPQLRTCSLFDGSIGSVTNNFEVSNSDESSCSYKQELSKTHLVKTNTESNKSSKSRTPKSTNFHVMLSPVCGADDKPKTARRWFPSKTEQHELYQPLSFVVDVDHLSKAAVDVNIWRIIMDDGLLMLQQFTPIDMKGRVFHKATGHFRLVEAMNQAFFIKYQPIYIMIIIDTERFQVAQYFNIEKIQPYLLKMRITRELFYDFKVVIQAIVNEVLTWPPGFIKSQVLVDSTKCDGYYKTSWESLEFAVTDRAKVIVAETRLASGLVSPFRNYPRIKFTKPIPDKFCAACVPKQRKSSARVKFSGKPYDQYSFEDLPGEFDPPEDLHLCWSCAPSFKIIDKLLNHKWAMYRAIRTRITDYVGELGPREFLHRLDVVQVFLTDHEWCLRSFLEFQVALAEADQEIERLKKESSRQVII